MSDFYIILPSNACKHTHPNNTASDFIIEWDSPYNLQGNWEVALTEMKCNFPLYTLPNNSKMGIETSKWPKLKIGRNKVIFVDNWGHGIYAETSKKTEQLRIYSPDPHSSFIIIFPSIEIAKKAGFEKRIVMDTHEIIAPKPCKFAARELITVRFEFLHDKDLRKYADRPPTHRLYKEHIERLNIGHHTDVYDELYYKMDEKLWRQLRLRNQSQKFFVIYFYSIEDAKKANFNMQMITGENALYINTWPWGENDYIDICLINPLAKVEVEYTEYQLSHTNLYFDSAIELANHLNTCNTPIEFSVHDGRIQMDTPDDIHTIHLYNPLRYILGFQNRFLQKSPYIANFKPQLNRAYDEMYIYTDIVTPSFVGGTLAPLLKSFAIKKSYELGEQLSFELTHPAYINVAKSSITQINVIVRDSKNEKIPFDSSAITTLTLHFRKKA